MIKKLFLNIPLKVRIFTSFLLIIMAAVFVGRFIFARLTDIPQDFLKSRQEASLIAQGIVSLSNDTAKNIGQISRLSGQGQDIEALNLIVRELEKNRESRQKAIALSSSLAAMARTSSQIYPDSAARTAIEAVSVETTLISRLVDYNDYLNQLLEILQEKLLGKGDSLQQIDGLVKKINDEVKAINDLNKQFNDLMAKFDLKS